MEGYLTSLSLGEESSQMWALNKRLEAYLSRVKALEEENELLRTEIHTLKKSKSERCWKNKFQVELHKLRDAVDDSHRELVLAERSRDSIWEEVEFVKHLCLQEQQAQEDANKELYESKKLLEEEKRTQSWLKEKLAQLEGELEDILAAHEEEKALVEEEIVSFSQRLENFRVAPVAIKAVDVEDYANRVSEIWHGAVESYKSQVSELEASLSEANDNLKKVQDENKLSKIQLQNLDKELQSLKVRKEMLEELLSRQWQEQQEDEGKLQLEVEALEKEKMELREEIAQVLEDRQQLMHLKMSLSLEVATYRSLLEAESTRMYTPVKDYKISSSFYDSTLEQKNARKRQTESSRKQMSKGYRLSSSKKQEEEKKELLWSTPNRLLNVKSTTFKNKTSPVTKEFQKVSSVLQSQDLKYTKASNNKVLPSIESNLKKLPQNEEVLNKNKTITNSYYKGSAKIISEKTERNEITSVPVLHQNTRSADTKEFNKIEVLDNGKSEPSSPNIEDVLIAQLDNTHLETTEKIEQNTSISVLHQKTSSADTNELYKYEVLDSSPNIEDELIAQIKNYHSESNKEVKEKHIDEPSDFVLRDEDISDIHKGYEENIEEKHEEETVTKDFLPIKALEDEISNSLSLEESCENAENVLSSKHLNEDIIKDRVVSAVIQDIASEIPISEVTIQVIEKDTLVEEVNYQRMHIEKQEELDYKDVEITDKEVSQEGAQVLTIAELSPVNTVANLASSSEVAEISVLKEIRCFQTNTYEHMKIATFSTANDEISEVIRKSLGKSLENELLVATRAEFEPKSDKESDSECQLSSNSQHLVDNISDTYEANKKTDDEEDGVYLCQKEQKHDEVVEASSMQLKEESRLFEDEGRKELNNCATEEDDKVFQDNGDNTQLLHGEQVASHLSDANQDQDFELDAESIQQNQEQHKSFELSENELDNTTNTVQEMPLSYDERKQSLIKAYNEELKDNEQIYQQISHSVLSFQPIGDVESVICQIDDKQDIQDLNDPEEYEQHSDTEYVERIQQNQEHNSFELIEDELDNSKLTNKVQEIPLSYDEGKEGLIVTDHEELQYDEQAFQQISNSVVSSQPIVDKESVIPQIDDKQDIQDINNAEEFENHSETEHVESMEKIQEQHKSFELSEDELDNTKLTNMEQETPLSYDEGKQDIIAADNGELKDDEQVFQQISHSLVFSQPTGDVESVVHQIDDKQDIQDINDAEKDEYHSDTEYVYQQHENDNICHLDIKNSEAEGELTFILEKDNIPKDDEESKLGEPEETGIKNVEKYTSINENINIIEAEIFHDNKNLEVILENAKEIDKTTTIENIEAADVISKGILSDNENNEMDAEKSEIITACVGELYVKTENYFLLASEPIPEDQVKKGWEENNTIECKNELSSKATESMHENLFNEDNEQSSSFSENEVELLKNIDLSSKEQNTNSKTETEKIIVMEVEKSEIRNECDEEQYVKTEMYLPPASEPTTKDQLDKEWEEDTAIEHREEYIREFSEKELEKVNNIVLASEEQNSNLSTEKENFIEVDVDNSEIITECDEEQCVKTENDLPLSSEPNTEDQVDKEWEEHNLAELKEKHSNESADTMNESILNEDISQSFSFSENEVELVNKIEQVSKEENTNFVIESETIIKMDLEKSEIITEEPYTMTENDLPLELELTNEDHADTEWVEDNAADIKEELSSESADTMNEKSDPISYVSENEVEQVSNIELANKEQNIDSSHDSEKNIETDLEKSENDSLLASVTTSEDQPLKEGEADNVGELREEEHIKPSDTIDENILKEGDDQSSYFSKNEVELVNNLELASKERNANSSTESENNIETDLEKSELVTELEEQYVKTENNLPLTSEPTSENQPLKEWEENNEGELRKEEHNEPSDTIDENILKEGDDQSSYFSENEVELVNKIEQASKEENTNFIIESEKIIKMDLEKSEIIIEEPYAMTENDLPLELEPTNEDHADKAWVEDNAADIKEELSSESADTMNEKSDPISYVSENELEQVSNIELANKEQNINSSSDSEKIIETDLEKSEIVTEFEEQYVNTENDSLLASEPTSEDQPLKEGEADNVGELRNEEHIKPSDTIDQHILKEGDDQSSYFSKNEVELVNNLELAREERNANSSTESENNIETDLEKSELVTEIEEQYVKTENYLPLTSEPTSENQPLKEWEENNEGEHRKEEHNEPSDIIDENILKEGDDQSSYFSENQIELVNNIELASKERNANFSSESENNIETDLEKSEIVTEFEEQYVKTENDFLLASEPTSEDQPLKEGESDNVAELRKEEHIKSSDTIDENILKESDEQSSYYSENEVEPVNNIELANKVRNANSSSESENNIETDLEKSEIVTKFEEQYVKTENYLLLASETTSEDQPLKEGEADNVAELRKEEHIKSSDTIDENILKEGDDQSSYLSKNELELINNKELANEERNANSSSESENNIEIDLEKSEIVTEFEEQYVKTENDLLLASETTSEDQPLKEGEADNVGELRKEELIKPSDTIDENILKEGDDQSSYFSENEVELVNNIELANEERNANSSSESENNIETDLEKSEIVTEFEEQYVKTENDFLLASEPTNEDQPLKQWEEDNVAELRKEEHIQPSDTIDENILKENDEQSSYFSENEVELVNNIELASKERNANSGTESENNHETDLEKSEIVTEFEEQYVKTENVSLLASEPTTEEAVQECEGNNEAELQEETISESAENELELVSKKDLEIEEQNTNSSTVSEKNVIDVEKSEIIAKSDEEQYVKSENDLRLALEPTTEDLVNKEWREEDNAAELKAEHSNELADFLNENILKEFSDSSSSFSENEVELVSNIEIASELKNTNSSPESEKINEIADYEEKYAESENNLPLATEFTAQNHADSDQEVVEFKEEHSSKIRIIELSAEDLTEINVHHLDYEHKTNILEFSAEVNLVEEQSEFENSSVNPESSKTENEISESEESANSQEDISFSSQKTADFEISKDYQLEQTLPDTTPLPNLEDEFGDLTVEQAELPLDTPLNDKDTKVFQNKDNFVESLTEDNATTVLNQESSFPDDSYSNESKEDTFDGQVMENLPSEQEVEEPSNSTAKADVDINEVVEIIEKSDVIHGNKDESVDNGLNNIEHFDPETQKLLFDKNVTTVETQAELKQSKVVDTDNEYSALAEDSPNTAQISDAFENDRNSIIEDNNVNRGLEESEITKLQSDKEIQDEEKLFNVESPSASSVTEQTDSSENPSSDSDKKGDPNRNTQCELRNRTDAHDKEVAEQSEHPIKENRIENDISAEKVNGFHENKTVNDELNLSDNILSTHINGEQSGLLHSNENTFENLEGEIADSYTETEEHPVLKFGVSQSKSEGLF